MPIWLLELPVWALAVLIVGGFVVVAGLALLVTRKWVLPRLHIRDSDAEFGGAMVQGVLVFYALAVALVAVGAWENHASLEEQSSREAATIAALYRQSALYPEPVSTQMQQQLVAYTTYVVDESWPLQAKGIVPSGGQSLVTDLRQTLGTFEPATPGQQAVHQEVLRIFTDLVELRRLRLDSVGGHLSPAMWSFVLIGGVLAIVSSFLFLVHDWRLHLAQVTLLSAFIGMVVLLIAVYDQPFVGDLAVTSESFRLILETVR